MLLPACPRYPLSCKRTPVQLGSAAGSWASTRQQHTQSQIYLSWVVTVMGLKIDGGILCANLPYLAATKMTTIDDRQLQAMSPAHSRRRGSTHQP
jgi:hypothetical protein